MEEEIHILLVSILAATAGAIAGYWAIAFFPLGFAIGYFGRKLVRSWSGRS